MKSEHLRASARASRAYSDRSRVVGFLLFLALALGLSFPYFEGTRNANELPRLLQGMAWVDTGVWAIDGPGARRIRPGPDVSRSHVDGRIYPNKPPGTTLVCALAYRAARAVHGEALTLRHYTWWARIASGLVPTLLLCWFLLRRLSRAFSRAPAVAAVALYALATPAAAYAHLAYGHQLAAALLCIGVTLCVDASTLSPEAFSLRSRVWRAVGGGALAGAAVTVEYGAVFAGLPLGLFLVWRARTRGQMPITLSALLGALVPVALLGAYHRTVYGSVLSTGYHHVTNPDFAQKHGQGFLGLSWPSWDGFHTHVLAADTGLLWWAPLFPLALYGLARASSHRDNPAYSQARVHLAIFGLYIVIVSGLSFTGGWRVGPRYLVAVLPLLAMGWAEAMGQIRNSVGWLIPVLGLAGYALVVNALAANLWPHIDPTNVNQPVSEVLIPLWQNGHEPYGILRSWGGVEAVRSVIALAVIGGGWALVKVVEPMPKTMVAVAAAVLVSVALLLATRYWPPHPKGLRNLAYISRSWEPDVEPQAADRGAVLHPLAQGVVDKGPRRKPAMIPPR